MVTSPEVAIHSISGQAIFGGSFDPVHIGHVKLAREIQKRFHFSPLWIVPSRIQPLKPHHHFDEQTRIETVRTAFSTIPGTKISTFEIDQPDVSYAIRTIEHFCQESSSRPLWFLSGSDSFAGISRWHLFEKVLTECNHLVVTRTGGLTTGANHSQRLTETLSEFTIKGYLTQLDPTNWATKTKTIIRLESIALPDISSTEVRNKLQRGESVTGLVPAAVIRQLKRTANEHAHDT